MQIIVDQMWMKEEKGKSKQHWRLFIYVNIKEHWWYINMMVYIPSKVFTESISKFHFMSERSNNEHTLNSWGIISNFPTMAFRITCRQRNHVEAMCQQLSHHKRGLGINEPIITRVLTAMKQNHNTTWHWGMWSLKHNVHLILVQICCWAQAWVAEVMSRRECGIWWTRISGTVVLRHAMCWKCHGFIACVLMSWGCRKHQVHEYQHAYDTTTYHDETHACAFLHALLWWLWWCCGGGGVVVEIKTEWMNQWMKIAFTASDNSDEFGTQQ